MKSSKQKIVGLGVSALTLVATSVLASTPQQVTSSFDVKSEFLMAAGNKADNAEVQGRYIIVFKKDSQNISSTGNSRSGAYESMVNAKGELITSVAEAKVTAMGGKVVQSIGKQRMTVAHMNKNTYNRMLQDDSVESISADPRRYLLAQSEPFGISMVQANQLTQTDLDARKVCIIDTGYDYGHEDLPTTSVSGDANSSQVGAWDNDGHGHGAHVAGTIGALDNNTGVVGVYPGVDMHIVKIFNDQGNWTNSSDLIAGIQQCADAGVNIVSMSLGGGSSTSAEESAMNGFVSDGLMLIAAAGNDGNSSLSYPASYDAVMSVAAVDSAGSVANFSQYNSQVEIAAPGVAVNSTLPGDTYQAWNGTSMATPHVSGVAALVWSFYPQCSNEQIREALNATADDRGASGKDNFYGWGIVKAKDTYDYLNTWGCAGDPDFPPTDGGNGGGDVDPVSGQLTGLSGSRGSWDRYTWDIPAGVAVMQVSISGGSGDADLYLKLGSQPSTSSYDCRPYLSGNDETCTVSSPSAGTWHIGINAYRRYNGVTLDYSYQ